MSSYEQKTKWGVISLIMVLLPLPLIGSLLWFYNLMFNGAWFYILLPITIMILIGLYIGLLIIQSIIVFKLYAPLKEGTFSIHSKEMDTWLASMIIVTFTNLIKSFGIPPSILRRFFNWVFDTNVGEILVLAGTVEHSLVDIGDHTVIGANSQIWGHAIEGDKIYIKKVRIGNHCTIGANTLIMPGVEIGDGTIVGACSLVTKNKKLEPNSLYLGVPARKVKKLKKKP